MDWSTIAAAAVEGAFVMLGAGGAAFLAIRQFYKQRSADRRLEWYERVARSLSFLSWKLQAFIHDYERGRAESSERHMATINGALDQVVLVLGERQLYAKQSSFDAIEKMIRELNALGSMAGDLEASGVTNVRVTSARAMLNTVNIGLKSIAEEGRVELFRGKGEPLIQPYERKQVTKQP